MLLIRFLRRWSRMARLNQRKPESIECWVQKDWVLKQNKLGVFHTMLWSEAGGEAWVKIRITIEELGVIDEKTKQKAERCYK